MAGDDAAFAALFDRHHGRVYRHALRFAGSKSDAEDITAMVFFEAWRKRDQVRLVEGSIIGWLLVTTANIARNAARSARRHGRLLAKLRPEAAPDHSDFVHAALELPHVQASVQKAFARLSVRDQQVLALCVLEEIPPSAAAALLRVSPGTLRTRLSRAKARLRTLIEDAGNVAGEQEGAPA